MSVVISGSSGITTPAVDTQGNLAYTGTLTGGTGVVNLGSGQLFKDASGNVGIGTSSPSELLSVNGNVGSAAAVFSNFGSATTAVVRLGDGNTGLFRPAANTIGFTTNGTERARIDSSGNLLVGTTSATARIVARATASTFGLALLDSGGALRTACLPDESFSYQWVSVIKTNGNAVWRFENASAVNVGNIIVGASATTYATSSDYRLKHDIQPMTGALAKVQQLKPVTYKWNADNSESQGFIAHELQEVVPECVTGEKDAVDKDGNPVYQGIDTSFLSATLTAALQELHQIVQAQAAELDTVKAELATLKGA